MSKKEEYKQLNLKFLEEYKQKEDVWTLPEGVMYRVITSSESNVRPSATSVVSVYYKGSLINGRVFDDNMSQPCAEPFRLNEEIAGWQIVLPHISVGERWEVVIPATLAYGSKGTDGIPRNSTLIFEIELVNVF